MGEILSAPIDRLAAFLLSPGSLGSVWSLLAAFTIAAGIAIWRRGGRSVRTTALLRGMFPRHFILGASARADLAFTALSVFASGLLFGWAVLSHVVMAEAVGSVLGTPSSTPPTWLAVAFTTLALWFAYEFAYWLAHILSHKIPALWAFHKVHHSAETLSPLTVFRVHPIDSLVFYNIVAVVTGVTAGAMHALVGAGVAPLTYWGANILTLIALFTIKHLHHSHVWLAWGGGWGRVILSPAHHQIHHSVATEHHDRNFGDMLGLFDWLAGTLHDPQPRRERLIFGVADYDDPHSFKGALVTPFGDAIGPLGAPSGAAAARPQT